MRLFSDKAGGARPKATTLSKDGGKRGMALLMVLTSIAVLTAVVVEFAYETRVDATLAANARDELRAEYMARSAVNLSRLVLHFQNQFDKQGAQLGQAIGAATGGQAMAMPKIRLWELLPVESSSINMFVGAVAGPPPEDVPLAPTEPKPGEAVPAAGLQMFGTYEGSFAASIEDEESKFNLNRISMPGTTGAVFAQQLALLWRDPRWDFLFDEDTAHKERYTREELVVHIKDWIDENEVGSAVDRVTGQLTDGFSDEVGPYTRYRPDYKPKNAKFDSLAEMYQVAGIGDRFMAAFGDRFTVFPDPNTEMNVNTSDPMQQYVNILIAAENPDLPALKDPMVIQALLQEIETLRMFGGFMGITVQQFSQVLMGAGINVRREIQYSPQQNEFLGDTSQTFRIEATGQVGDVNKKITAVVRYDDKLGTLLYWRED
ncbi:general secretion pathway protein GspK [Vulgatibacter sp.]|uniref:general secretion pathway protein GspK n=1 Tax=Vulgatibacter sp. TaxID=1971226 RepID=UPI0035623031